MKRLILLIAVWTTAHAHEPGGAAIEVDIKTGAKPWTHLNVNNDPDSFQFGIVTDNAGGPRDGIFAETMDKLNLMQPEFVMSIGDYVEGYVDTAEELNRQWEDFMGDVARLQMPFFFVPGNHDNGRPLWAEVYNQRFGVPYYHFKYKNVLFLCLCTNDGPENNTGMSQAQVDYVAKTLEEHPDVRWTLVFQHKPLWNDDDAAGWKQIEELLQGRKCSVFAGHTHNYLHQERDGISYITMATSGGGSALRGPAYGEFDHFAWVTMTDDGPIVANLLLDGVLPADLRTPEMAEELQLFRADRAVLASPILYDGAAFHHGHSTVSIANPADRPLRFKALLETQPGVRAEPSAIATVLAPGQSFTAEVHVTADAELDPGRVEPVVIHWEGHYDSMENKPSLELAGQRRILIDTPAAIPVLDHAVEIDGKLDEWAAMPFAVNQPGEIFINTPAWKGPHDGAYRFAVARDDAYLYVAVDVRDNDPSFEGWKYWEDFAMVAIDPRAGPDGDLEEAAFSIIAGPEMTRDQAAEYEMGSMPDGAETASVAGAHGFTTEFAIPLAAIDAHQDGAWERLRLNVGVSDFDPSDARDGVTILYWRPQWTSPHTYAESGIFTK